jgi:hypothetical protein
VIAVPEQMLFCEAVILTAGTTDGNTVMVRLFDVPVAGDAQAALDVSTQLTTAPLVNVLLLNTLVSLPALLPSTSH